MGISQKNYNPGKNPRGNRKKVKNNINIMIGQASKCKRLTHGLSEPLFR
jgi:hypothetical protein